ncbi:pentraxin fusion protein-like isoform X2 [Anarrhichthys ocellatus]|nr:pentraxin fusion protein-like isoform X2 [Anarrhichthys ocellatus]
MLWSLTLISLIGRARLNGDIHETGSCNGSDVTELNVTTSQSSNYTGVGGVVYSSEKAIEDVNNCSHTNKQIDPWWRIDLLGVYRIHCISIFNTDHHNANINGAKIYIGNSRKKNSTTNLRKNITDFTQKKQNNFFFNTNVSGRYITVFFPEMHFLILCGMKIFGTKKESPFMLIREKKTWVEALEHCRDQDMHLASIVDRETQTWAELEARNSNTHFVWLGLRYTCILEFWFWVEDLPVKFNRWAQKGKKDDCNMSGAMDRKEKHLWYSKSDVGKFNFICAK